MATDAFERFDHALSSQPPVMQHAAIGQARMADDAPVVLGIRRSRQQAEQLLSVVHDRQRQVTKPRPVMGKVATRVQEGRHWRGLDERLMPGKVDLFDWKELHRLAHAFRGRIADGAAGAAANANKEAVVTRHARIIH
ncbi:MAG: hypothetical protein ACXW2T_03950 [Allosphingosinicella sp.]